LRPAALNTTVGAPAGPAGSDLRRVLLFAFVYALAIWLALLPSGVTDPDLGWHLRTGEWILSHRMVPVTDPFSQFGATRPWIAYSWLFDLLLVVLTRTFGLAGVLIYTAIFTVAILMTLHLLLARAGAGAVRVVSAGRDAEAERAAGDDDRAEAMELQSWVLLQEFGLRRRRCQQHVRQPVTAR